jgi:hypothetical protein
VTWSEFYSEDPQFWNAMWTCHPGALYSVRVNWHTFVRKRKRFNNYAESIRRHHTQFSRPGNQARWMCTPLFLNSLLFMP